VNQADFKYDFRGVPAVILKKKKVGGWLIGLQLVENKGKDAAGSLYAKKGFSENRAGKLRVFNFLCHATTQRPLRFDKHYVAGAASLRDTVL